MRAGRPGWSADPGQAGGYVNRKRKPLCGLEELPEGASRGFSVLTENGSLDLFLVRRDGLVSAYRNSCPHTGGPLDWVPDQFLNLDGDLIQCATHDALFRIDNGACVAGPCAGESLTAVPVETQDGVIYLKLDELGGQ